jgi:hypothetical protein
MLMPSFSDSWILMISRYSLCYQLFSSEFSWSGEEAQQNRSMSGGLVAPNQLLVKAQ